MNHRIKYPISFLGFFLLLLQMLTNADELLQKKVADKIGEQSLRHVY